MYIVYVTSHTSSKVDRVASVLNILLTEQL